MVVSALVLSIVAIVVSIASVIYTRRSTLVSERADQRDRKPTLTLKIDRPTDGETLVRFLVHNDGPEDLSSVVVERPRQVNLSDDRQVTYDVANPSGELGPQAEIGPILNKAHSAFHVGTDGRRLKDMTVRITCRIDRGRWRRPEQWVDDYELPRGTYIERLGR